MNLFTLDNLFLLLTGGLVAYLRSAFGGATARTRNSTMSTT